MKTDQVLRPVKFGNFLKNIESCLSSKSLGVAYIFDDLWEFDVLRFLPA